MTSCRGILIAGVTNRARTQMAEGFLRAFTAGRVFVLSGGVRHEGTLHPMAVSAMRALDIDISTQSPSSLQGPRHQRSTYDVYISIDAPYGFRGADRYQRTCAVRNAERAARTAAIGQYGDPRLAPPTPSHWGIGLDATDAHQRWELWSPRDPAVYSERSTRRFQDDLYEGEPLFMQLETNLMRVSMKVTQRWEVDEVCDAFAMERPLQQHRRVVQARDDICVRCVQLLHELENFYGEKLLVDSAALEKAADAAESVRTLLQRQHSGPSPPAPPTRSSPDQQLP